MQLNTPQEIIDEIRQGRMVILMDDEDGSNGGAVVIAAERVTDKVVNFMSRNARGLICLSLTRELCQKLNLPLMVQETKGQHRTNFTTSIEAAQGVTTGISAADRATTIKVAVAPSATAEDIVQPGHVFPLMAEDGGVLIRAGHTEAGCDLARLAGYVSAAAITDVLNNDGTIANRADLEQFAESHDLKIGTIADLIHYRLMNEKTVEAVKSGKVRTEKGEFDLHVFRDTGNNAVHLALVKGQISATEPTLVRVHQPSALRDVVGAQPPGSDTWNLQRCLARVAREGAGVVVVIASDITADKVLNETSIALGEKPVPDPGEEGGRNVYNMVGVGSQILRQLGVGKMRLMAQPVKYNAISGFDLEVVEYVSCDQPG
jgi:3,4-dihydroxy 2-butanone 4-phosphate synthase/GTP cyclohydrolase II